jgi:hypothetical protein
VRELASDEELSQYVDDLANQIRGRPRTQGGKRDVDVLSSVLLQQLPQDIQQSITARLKQACQSAGTGATPRK